MFKFLKNMFKNHEKELLDSLFLITSYTEKLNKLRKEYEAIEKCLKSKNLLEMPSPDEKPKLVKRLLDISSEQEEIYKQIKRLAKERGVE